MKHHAYCHAELKFICDVCKQGFAFESELNSLCVLFSLYGKELRKVIQILEWAK